MKIYLGADHNGFELKARLASFLRARGHEVVDEGARELKPEDDYPQFAARVVSALQADDNPEARGLLICGSGQGMAIAANRFKGIRATLCWDTQEARMSRNDDDSNVLCLPSRLLSEKQAESITHTWLSTPFAKAPRFVRRIKELDELG